MGEETEEDRGGYVRGEVGDDDKEEEEVDMEEK